MLIRTVCIIALFMAVGCSSIGEGYSAHYGLTNPESDPAYRNLTDEAFASGVVGDQYIEDYEKKYREKDVLKASEPETPGDEDRQP